MCLCMCRGRDNFGNSVLSSSTVRLGGKHLYWMSHLFSPWAAVSKHTPSDLFLLRGFATPSLHMSVCDVDAHVCEWSVCACLCACMHACRCTHLCMSVYMYVSSHSVQMYQTMELWAPGPQACLAFIWVLGIQMLVLTLGWQVLYPLSRLPKLKALTLKSFTISSNSIVSWGPRVQKHEHCGERWHFWPKFLTWNFNVESVPEILKLARSEIGPFPPAFAFNEALGKAANLSVSLSLNTPEGFSAEVVGFPSCAEGLAFHEGPVNKMNSAFRVSRGLKKKMLLQLKTRWAKIVCLASLIQDER